MALCRPVPPKQEVEICESFKGGWWWKRGEKSFQSSHALNSHNCFPNIIGANYQQAIGGFSWPDYPVWAGGSSTASVWQAGVCLVRCRGQWLGHKAEQGLWGHTPFLSLVILGGWCSLWLGSLNASVSHTCQITSVPGVLYQLYEFSDSTGDFDSVGLRWGLGICTIIKQLRWLWSC